MPARRSTSQSTCPRPARTSPISRISVDSVAAVGWGASNFTNESQTTTFERDLALHSPTMRIVRRAVRVAVALAAAAVAFWLLVRLRRRFARQGRVPGLAWTLLVPFALIGLFGFWAQLSAGLDLHGLLFAIVCTAAWWAILALPSQRPASLRLRRYRITPTDRMVPTAELEEAWGRTGLVVVRRRRRLNLLQDGALVARVAVPPAEVFGGAPFESRADQRATAERMMAAAAPLLGELRGAAAGEPELRVPAGP